MVDDLVELLGQHAVASRDRALERSRQITVEGNGPGESLFDEGLDEFLGAVGFGLLGGRNDLFQNAGRRGRFGGAGLARDIAIGNGSALLLAEPQFA
jgi:hypothetical protein